MLKTTAVVQLSIVGVEVRSNIVTLRQVSDILGVCRKLYRAENGALVHTAVYWEALSLMPIVYERLSSIA